ncbi:carbohydrate ABC transporter permease [Subtercola frigoramans]|uniref:Multiple sugar transport system permease protein n=1 Tax=Subtercola frigoramans TaxID=120298 RepID=A0ABS2L2A5_9MICO|nr:sugar ABC transporter permease [Subtercola frigoramans]MBM7471202.1 multiple sugar transport system permease protein [Subtercola frigoramans]
MTTTAAEAGTEPAAMPRRNRGALPTPTPRPIRATNHRRHEVLIQWAFVAPAILYIAFFFGYPVAKNIVMSLQDYTTKTFYTGEAPFVGVANYVTVIASSLFPTTIINTALFTVGSIIGQFAIGLALALFFQRRFPLNSFLRALLLVPWLLPLIASSAVWKWMLDQDSGVINELLKALHLGSVPWLVDPNVALVAVILVNVWLGIPFNVTILYSGLQEIPPELYEAAALDGATRAQTFWNITWPNLRPVVSVVLVLGVVYTLKVLDIILGLTGGGPANSTQTLATDSYHRSFVEFAFGPGAAVSNILIVISLVFSFIYLRSNRRAVDE